MTCTICGGADFLVLPTYKRHWHFCRSCGTATSAQRKRYPLALLPFPDYRRQAEVDEALMYDYFVEPAHVEWSIAEGEELLDRYLRPHGVDVAGKSVLDVSGGNGHVLKQVERAGATVALTEINHKTIEYARETHGFPVFEYNLNEHNLAEVTGRTFDVVLARACIMFAWDLDGFARQVGQVLNPGGLVIVHRLVKPTLGVMVRVQLDEFSYYVLRQPDVIADAFTRIGFELEHRIDEVDPSLYAYDHDMRKHWLFAHYLYEIRNVMGLRRDRPFDLPARDRRLGSLFLRGPS
jgi:SAM-dependent methyltransferase